jgi:hypothetical protein
MTRRTFLRSAGGVTFLALVPVGPGLFAAPIPEAGARLPLFTVLPYIQPGPNSLLRDGDESMVVAWQTYADVADFSTEFGSTTQYGTAAVVSHTSRAAGHGGDAEQRFNWTAVASGLALGRKYYYRVRGNGQVLSEGYFTTRQPRGRKIRFVAFGDNSYGDISDRAIAYHSYQQHPDFVMNCGDNVYESGSDDEYQRYFFPVYNADLAGPREGAPLLRSVPFYTVIANHDVQGKDADGHEIADFSRTPDALAFFTAMHLPLDPRRPYFDAAWDRRRRSTDFAVCHARFPRMANYSFDYGDALCASTQTATSTPTSPERGLPPTSTPRPRSGGRRVPPPAIQRGDELHGARMRVLAPLFRRTASISCSAATRQLPSRPLKFLPAGPSLRRSGKKDRRVPGRFTIDRIFDGVTNTRPSGFYTTGAGGKHLYDAGYTDKPAKWTHPDDGHADYVAKMITDRHSLSVFDVDGARLTLTQVDEAGQTIDRLTVTKERRETSQA